MKVGIIGRSEWTFESMKRIAINGHKIVFIVTSKETPEYKYSSEDFRNFANSENIPFLYDPKINLEKIKPLIEETKPDICISVNYSGVISQEVIDCFPYGILNAHGGDLPRYRGNACQAWAIINKEERIGLCIHKMIGGELDSGPIISRSYFPININTRIQQVYEWMEDEVPTLILRALNNLENNPNYMLEKQSTNPDDILRCYPRKPEDGKIDWAKDADEIVRLVNASSEPYGGAFTLFEGEKCIIWRASLHKDVENWCGVPGQVASILLGKGVVVLAGSGKVLVESIEINEEKKSPDQFISSARKRFK